MEVEYKGQLVSIYRLGQITDCPTSTLYRGYHNGLRTGEELVAKAREHLIEYNGKFITHKKLCEITNSDYKKVRRRIKAGLDTEAATKDKTDRRGSNKLAKLSPSDVLKVYEQLFLKQKTQTAIAQEYGVHPSTISDIWRHKRWDWLIAPLRFSLEKEK